MSKKLTLGLQDFRSIIEGGYKYIDKTQYIYNMCTSGKYFFLSRPRRFGKSITIAVLQELYLGSKELFKGLWIENKWDWTRKHPVIRISFTSIGYQDLGLRDALSQELQQIAKSYGLLLTTQGFSNQFKELIFLLEHNNKVILLIDEYDAPIVNYLGKEIDKAYENREILKQFYTVLKDCDAAIEFVFFTGVSKFSKVGIFSGLNNLIDLTMHPQYATMLGYTQEELESNFVEEIAATAESLNISRTELLKEMKLWYNGYRFEADAKKVYNPVSCNLFFYEQRFKNFWFATGTPTFLVNLLKQDGIFDLHFPSINPTGFESFELDRLKPVAILFQTGYLTIQEKEEDGLVQLDYPNKEVRDSMLEILIEAFIGVDVEFSTALIFRIRDAFKADDVELVIRILQGVFKGLPYFLHEKYPEKFFHAAIYLLFTYLGIRIHSEVSISDGRIVSLVETDSHAYILEYKLDETPQITSEQINKYGQAHWFMMGKDVIQIGVNFSSATRNIETWIEEKLG